MYSLNQKCFHTNSKFFRFGKAEQVLQVVCMCILFSCTPFAFAESPAPTVHWGGLGYPDQIPTVGLGFTINRFTEFDQNFRQFNDMRETMGINFGTISWTKFWDDGASSAWSTNLTVGAGPTGEQPSEWLQNEFVHEALYGIDKVPVEDTRNEFDFVFDGSATYWWSLGDSRKVIFAGGGFSSGSLYHELFLRGGARRLPIGPWLASFLPSYNTSKYFGYLSDIISGFRLSGMGRYGRTYAGAAFRDVAPQTYLGQASLSWGIFDKNDLFPFFEIELGVSIDSGLFTDFRGDSLEEKFISLITIRIRNFTFETWNDMINFDESGSKDFGPTYGGRIMFNIAPYLPGFFRS